MIRALFTAAKTFVVVKAVDAVIAAFTNPRTPARARNVAAPAKRAAAKSKPQRGPRRRAAA